MILTCPECATSYFVDDARIPATGRKVKCASCGARWIAASDPPPADDPRPAAILPDALSGPAPEPAGEAFGDVFGDLAVEPAADPEPAPESASESAPEPEPELRVRPARGGRRSKAGPGVELVALCVAAALALVAAGLVLLRGPIVRAMPAAAPLFSAVGFDTAASGLVIEGVHSQAAFQGDAPVLSVTGAVRNTGRKDLEVPPVRVRLLDRRGEVVAVRTATAEGAAAPAGATRYFVVVLPNPPSTAASMEVDFAPEGPLAR